MAVIETMTFELLPAVDDREYAALDAQIQVDFVYQQAGIIRRTLAHGDSGWLAETWWHSLDDAIAASTQFVDDDRYAAFVCLVDESSIRVSRYETV